MEVPVLFVVLSLCVNSGHGAPQVNSISRIQTWHQASNDSSCSMIGLNLTGEIEEYVVNITESIAWDTHQKAWIGAYAKRVWVNFDGCYFGRFKSNDSWLTLTSPGDPAKTCLKHCDFRTFVLMDGKCVCYKDVKYFTTTGCIAGECSDTKYTYCGKGNATNSNNFTFYCMCRFSIANNPSYISDKGGDCLAVNCTPQQHFIPMNCRNEYRPMCYNSKTNQTDLSRRPNNWLQSLSECYLNDKQFASRTTNLNPGLYNGTYWLGTFAMVYKEWGRPSSADYSCVAVSIDRINNGLTTVVLPCDTLLPALCSYPSLSTHSPIQTTVNVVTTDGVTASIPIESSTRLDKTSSSDQQTTSIRPLSISYSSSTSVNILTGGQNKDSVSVIVGSVVGSVVLITLITTVVLFLRHRIAFRKCSSGKGLGHTQIEEQIQSPVIHSERIKMNDDTLTVNDSVNVYENMKIRDTIGTETTDKGGNYDTHRYSERGITRSNIYSNDAAIYQPELFAEENPGSHYYGLSQPSHDEHEYGQLM